MSKFSFFLKRLVRMDWKAMWKTAGMLRLKPSGKSRLWLLADMLRCALKYNAGYVDYKIAQMYRLNDAQRKTQITRGLSNQIVRRMNDKAYWYLFDDKATFNELFQGRGGARLDEAESGHGPGRPSRRFWPTHPDIIAKPLEGQQRRGHRPLYRKTTGRAGRMIFSGSCWPGKSASSRSGSSSIPRLMALCPTSVNTIRIATLLGDKKQGIVYAFLRIGNGKVMDNVDQGGMAARVDLESGKLLTVGADKQGNTYTEHPMTHTPIVGFEVPFFEEAKAMCLQAAQKVPQMRFVAWDVAVTEKGPVFIEGNSFPSHAVPQFAAHYPGRHRHHAGVSGVYRHLNHRGDANAAAGRRSRRGVLFHCARDFSSFLLCGQQLSRTVKSLTKRGQQAGKAGLQRE